MGFLYLFYGFSMGFLWIMGSMDFWLVVDLPLWTIWVRQLGWGPSQYMEKYKMFQTTNQHMLHVFWVSYNISVTWIVRPWKGILSLINRFQWARSEVVIICHDMLHVWNIPISCCSLPYAITATQLWMLAGWTWIDHHLLILLYRWETLL